MREVGVCKAKTHLARLIDEPEHGKEVTITRHGKPVARLVPDDADLKRAARILSGLPLVP